MEKNIIHLGEIDSTNSYLKSLAANGAKAGTVVLADRQTNGRGRLGRSFFSPSSGLYMSVLLRPENGIDSLLITAAAAVAVVRAVECVSGIKCGIKWVNDIIYSGKKLCGILAEGVFDYEKNNLSYIVLGIGLNISDPVGGFPEEIKDIACSLFGEKKPADGFSIMLCERIFEEFSYIYENLSVKNFLEEYRNSSVLIGKEIYYISGGEKHFATVIGIDDNAGLLVNEDNRQFSICSGEVTVRENIK